jgi:hypothetical protein
MISGKAPNSTPTNTTEALYRMGMASVTAPLACERLHDFNALQDVTDRNTVDKATCRYLI